MPYVPIGELLFAAHLDGFLVGVGLTLLTITYIKIARKR